MKLVAHQLSEARQKWATSLSRQKADPNAFYIVKDYDQVQHVGYDLPYDFIGFAWYSGKPYNRKAEIDHYMEDMIMEFRIRELSFTKTDLSKLRRLFNTHTRLTAAHLIDVLNHQAWDILGGERQKPKKGHDWWYWTRSRENVKQFLRYLPQSIREAYVFEAYGMCGTETIYDLAEDGRPIFNYAGMPEPLLEVAFANEIEIPVTHIFEENEDGDWIERPIYYAEFVGEPVKEYVKFDANPVPLSNVA